MEVLVHDNGEQIVRGHAGRAILGRDPQEPLGEDGELVANVDHEAHVRDMPGDKIEQAPTDPRLLRHVQLRHSSTQQVPRIVVGQERNDGDDDLKELRPIRALHLCLDSITLRQRVRLGESLFALLLNGIPRWLLETRLTAELLEETILDGVDES